MKIRLLRSCEEILSEKDNQVIRYDDLDILFTDFFSCWPGNCIEGSYTLGNAYEGTAILANKDIGFYKNHKGYGLYYIRGNVTINTDIEDAYIMIVDGDLTIKGSLEVNTLVVTGNINAAKGKIQFDWCRVCGNVVANEIIIYCPRNSACPGITSEIEGTLTVGRLKSEGKESSRPNFLKVEKSIFCKELDVTMLRISSKYGDCIIEKMIIDQECDNNTREVMLKAENIEIKRFEDVYNSFGSPFMESMPFPKKRKTFLNNYNYIRDAKFPIEEIKTRNNLTINDDFKFARQIECGGDLYVDGSIIAFDITVEGSLICHGKEVAGVNKVVVGGDIKAKKINSLNFKRTEYTFE